MLTMALAAVALVTPQAAGAAGLVTACTPLDICYCVNSDYREVIDANVARVRQLIASNKAQGKAIGYLSIPLSPAGGRVLCSQFRDRRQSRAERDRAVRRKIDVAAQSRGGRR
jgi:hypothetical protein